MSGHSKWAQIKRQKGVADARRGQLFTKLIREITVAARYGADPESNTRLRLAMQRARESNMPMENMNKAIKRGAGGEEGSTLAEMTYEGYGPGGVAILLQALTDNRNRTVSDVRNTFVRGGGNLGASGCVSWLFEPKGVISIEVDSASTEDLALQAIDAGAEDVKIEGKNVEVYTRPEDLETVRKALEGKASILAAEVSMMPKTTQMLDEKNATQLLKLLDKLEELDDVQKVYTNADFPSEVLEQYQMEG
ncbi:MAG: YebC/PmpR family DNA-binding transcriptional regulator [Chloroflexi bacterium]|nr:YebC/PmpR family DNA-binding transcriptional regulator [Chloroflexota bacterium]